MSTATITSVFHDGITNEQFYQNIKTFLNAPDNFDGDHEEPYWVSRRYNSGLHATQEEMDVVVPFSEHLVVSVRKGNSEGWILNVGTCAGWLVASAKYFGRESAFEASKKLTLAIYQ
jgi:hypothetical protein